MSIEISAELYDELIRRAGEAPRPMTPKMREFLEIARADRAKFLSPIDRVLALHQSEDEDDVDETMDILCVHCSFVWPCPTVIAARGE